MTEKYILVDIINYVNKEQKKIYLACIYTVKGNRNALQNIVVSEGMADILQQYMYKEISNYLTLDYDIYNNNYKLKINVD